MTFQGGVGKSRKSALKRVTQRAMPFYIQTLTAGKIQVHSISKIFKVLSYNVSWRYRRSLHLCAEMLQSGDVQYAGQANPYEWRLCLSINGFITSVSFFFLFLFFATRIQKATETRVTLVGVKWRNLCITPLPWMYYKCFIKTWDFYMCCVWWRCCLCMFWKGDAFQFSGGTVMCLPAYPCKVGDRCTSRTTHFIGPI